MMANEKSDQQSIQLSRKQFLALLKLTYLGNWMANAPRTQNMKEDYESIESFVFSFAPAFGFEKYMDHEESDGDRYYPTGLFEEETDVHKLHEEYDEETFWDELADRLGERDFYEKYSKEEIKRMDREERFTKLYECIDAVSDELEKYGLGRLRIRGE